MVTFIGRYSSKVDDKGRLVFPSALKGALPAAADPRFIIKKSLYDPCLEMWNYGEWEKEADKIREGLDFFDEDHRRFWRQYLRDCIVVEPEPRLGRISIPKYLLDAIGFRDDHREAVFLGSGFKIEIWEQEHFGSSEISNEKYVAIAHSLSRK